MVAQRENDIDKRSDFRVPKKCLTYREASWSLGISERSLRNMVSRGQIPIVELAGKVLFDPEDLDDLKRKHKTVRNRDQSE